MTRLSPTFILIFFISFAGCLAIPSSKSYLSVTLLSKDGFPLPGQVIKLDCEMDNGHLGGLTDNNGKVVSVGLYAGNCYMRGGVHGILQATGNVTLLPGKHHDLTIKQDIRYVDFQEIEKE